MFKRHLGVLLVAVGTNVFFGCQVASTATSPNAEGNVEEKTGLKFFFTKSADAESLRITVKRTSCQGEPIASFEWTEAVALADPGDNPEDVFLQLDPGCYDIMVEPLDKSGVPSVDCQAQFFDQLVVIEGTTTEAGIQTQCNEKPQGALDVFVPVVHDVTSAHVLLDRRPCDGEAIQPSSISQWALVTTTSPALVNAFFVVQPGCYGVRVEPHQASGAPSGPCSSVQTPNVVVLDGQTTEVSAEFVCP